MQDLDNCLKGGADAVIFINEWCSLDELERVLKHVRKKYPVGPLGVNYLGDDQSDPYGIHHSFRLAREYNLQLVWTDFSGVDLIKEKSEISLHEIDKVKPENVFYCSGIHMKYSTLLDPNKPIEKSALQAMGWADGIIVTGPKTGVAADPEKMRKARSVIGDYPLGVASGVSPENVHQIREYCDFYIVASSLQDEKKRIVAEKVRRLREKL